MPRDKMKSQGKKTREQFLRNLERKEDIAKPSELEASAGENPATSKTMRDRDARQSEMPVRRRGMNQESDHNKHNDAGQSGHTPQKHSAAEEKQQ